MKKTLDAWDFVNEFLKYRPDTFSREGLFALFDFFESMEDEENEIEFDPVAICCDFSEYKTALEAAKDYGGFTGETEEEAREFFENRTTLLDVEGGGIIFQNF